MSPPPLRLVIHDRTCRGRWWRPGLTDAWAAGARLYRALGRVDAWRGVASWPEALAWAAEVEPGRLIGEVQYWGHGRWGRALAGADVLDAGSLAPAHPLHAALAAVRARLAPDALWWFRTCETFGTAAGHDFARAFARFLGCRVAGHTYVIGAVQSGLHSLLPGAEPAWSATEGLPPGVPDPPTAARSSLLAPNTITCLHGRVPPGM